ncbi:MAG: hypothetical protein KAT54_06940 [Candidatus Marinimicrobia bacterium]|nr:hypothetical protein [Candidatus Neomarinimicrobiota bacterium]
MDDDNLLSELEQEKKENEELERQKEKFQKPLDKLYNRFLKYASTLESVDIEIETGSESNVTVSYMKFPGQSPYLVYSYDIPGELTKSFIRRKFKSTIKWQGTPLSISFFDAEIMNGIFFSKKNSEFYLSYRIIGSCQSLTELEDLPISNMLLHEQVLQIIPEMLSDKDIENCFRFLIGKTYDITISQNAIKKGCYIATTIYDSDVSVEVLTLKWYRDNVLLKLQFGSYFVRIYNTLSPYLSKKIGKNNFLKKTVKNFILSPILKYLYAYKQKL